MNTKKYFKQLFKMSPAKFILLGFASIILVGAFLLCLPVSNKSGEWVPFIDGLFTSTSSVCVTGLMVYDVASTLTIFGQIIVMLLIQIGGLGFVAITSLLFLMIGKKIDYATRLTIQESLNKEDTEGVVKTIIFVLLATLVCELLGFLALLPSMIEFSGSVGMGMFRALFLSISAFCNAGFDPLGASTPEFSNLAFFADKCWILIPVMFLIVLGGIGFIVFIDIFQKIKGKKKFNLHTRVVLWLTGILIVLSSVLIMVLEWNNPNTIGNMSTGNKITNAFFQGITIRTAGFATFDQSQMNPISVLICEIFMFIGGAPASMAGGIKITTFFVLLLLLTRSTDQHGNIIYRTKKISNTLITKATKIVLIAVGTLFVGTTLVFLFEGGAVSLDAVIFECVSALCTVGLSFGITPALCWQSKFILSLMMYMGRIGMLTIPLAFKVKNQPNSIEYVDAKITVG